MHDRPRKQPTMANGNQNDIVLRNKFGVMAARKARLSLWICGQCCAPAGLPWITMKPLSTAPASAHKLHRPQVFCMKDRPNDNYLEVTFFGEATGPDKMIVAAQQCLTGIPYSNQSATFVSTRRLGVRTVSSAVGMARRFDLMKASVRKSRISGA